MRISPRGFFVVLIALLIPACGTDKAAPGAGSPDAAGDARDGDVDANLPPACPDMNQFTPCAEAGAVCYGCINDVAGQLCECDVVDAGADGGGASWSCLPTEYACGVLPP